MPTIKGGTKFTRALDTIVRKLSNAKTVQVGFFENAKYPDGTPVAMVAAINNYGAPARGIPPRPFFTNMVADKSEGWSDAIEKNLTATKFDANLTLERVGKGVSEQLVQTIEDFNGVPLKPATIKAKGGRTKQLIDTQLMRDSVTYKVKT